MKALIVYFSRTQNTEKVALKLADSLKCDIEELKDNVRWKGFFGYVKAGRHAMKKKLSKIKPLEKNIEEYDLIIFAGPIWAWDLSVPIRTFLENYKDKLQKTAFACTQGGNGAENAFESAKDILKNMPLAKLVISAEEVKNDDFNKKIEKFVQDLE